MQGRIAQLALVDLHKRSFNSLECDTPNGLQYNNLNRADTIIVPAELFGGAA